MTSRRQRARMRRTAGFWAAKVSQARTPVDRAALAWDRLRAQMRELPADGRDQAWLQVARRLDELRAEVTDCEVDTGELTAGRGGFGGSNGQTRARA